MASPYSQPIQYKEREDQFNLPLLQQALGMRQEKYDYNRAKVQQTINNLAGLDLIRGVDQDYLYERLEKVVDTLNQDGSRDVSLDSQADYLSTYVSQVADDKIVNAYYGTQSVRNIQEQAEAARESGEYSDINYAYSMQDATAWMANPEAGAAYRGRTDYVPYADINEAMIKSIEAMEASKFSHIDEYGKYHFYKVNGEELSEERVKMAAELTLKSDPKLMAQTKVNAWSQFQGVDDNAIIGNYKEVMTSRYDYYDELTKEYNRKLATAETDAEIEEIQQYLEAFESEKQTINDVLNTSPDKISREAVENEMYLDQLLNQYAQTYAYKSITDSDIISNDLAISRAESAVDVISKVIMLRGEGKYGTAEEYYNNFSGLLADAGYPTQYSTWSPEQSMDEGTEEPIVTEGAFSKQRAMQMEQAAARNIDSSIQGAYTILVEAYGKDKLKQLGYINKDGSINKQLVATDMKSFYSGGGLLSDTAIERLGGSPLTDNRKQELYRHYENYSTNVPIIDAFSKAKETSLSTDNALTDFFNNVAGNEGIQFMGLGIGAQPVISVYEPSVATQGRVTQPKGRGYKIYYDNNAGSYVIEEGTYTTQVVFKQASALPAINAGVNLIHRSQMLGGLFSTLGITNKANISDRPKQFFNGDPSTRRYITEDEARQMVLESDGNKAEVNITLPDTKTGLSRLKFWDDQKPVDYYSPMGEVGTRGAADDMYLFTAGELADMTTSLSYYVTRDEPATIEAASELIQIANSNGENLTTGMKALADPEFYDKLKTNAITGSSEQIAKTKVNLPDGLKFYYNPVTDMATLEGDGKAYDIPLQQLNPEGAAYYMLMTNKQVADTKLKYNLKAKFKFDNMKDPNEPVLTETEDSYKISGSDIMPSLGGYNFNLVSKSVFTKDGVNGNTIQPKLELEYTTPQGQKKTKVLDASPSYYPQSDYSSAVRWLQDRATKFYSTEDMDYYGKKSVQAYWIEQLFKLGVISEQDYLNFYDNAAQ